MEGKEIASIGETRVAVPPATVISEAKIAVNVFKGVIELKPKKVILNGEQYLEYEDWQTLGEFYRCSAVTRDAIPVEIDGVKGAKAKADLVNIDTGLVIGGAEAYCMRDEDNWNTRPKYEWQGEGANRKRVKVSDEIVPWFQLASMAQTRAGAKAYRNRLAWVAVMAGYRPTPAEEMTESTVSEKVSERRTVDNSAHYCPTHEVNFFKKGRMKNYAHPIEGTDEWCNEPEKATETPQEAVTSTTQSVKEETKAEIVIDMDWLRESLESLGWTDVVGWLNHKYGTTGKRVSEIVKELTPDQQKEFANEVQERLDMS